MPCGFKEKEKMLLMESFSGKQSASRRETFTLYFLGWRGRHLPEEGHCTVTSRGQQGVGPDSPGQSNVLGHSSQRPSPHLCECREDTATPLARHAVPCRGRS